MSIRFGPAGAPESFYAEGYKSSLDMPAWLKIKGLDAFEYQCSRGVNIGEEAAKRLGALARENNILLSIHAPYYINLSTVDPMIRTKTKMHLIKSLRAARWMGATTVVFHPGSASGGDRQKMLGNAKRLLQEILNEVEEEGLADIMLAPETMGKKNQLGSLEEVLALCELSTYIIPALDFGHLHAVTGGSIIDKASFAAVLDFIEARLGREMLQKIHIHFSPVEFTKAGGEKKHRTLADGQFGPDFKPLAELLVERNLTPVIICESNGKQAEDALVYRSIYEQVKKNKFALRAT
ncbi:MAG: endonuclease IV [Peptococcaceae bacterium]|jgi:deoxyribonuclease-4|nr:MAG: endonuclease IV [Peptococcaceae bacterium]